RCARMVRMPSPMPGSAIWSSSTPRMFRTATRPSAWSSARRRAWRPCRRWPPSTPNLPPWPCRRLQPRFLVRAARIGSNRPHPGCSEAFHPINGRSVPGAGLASTSSDVDAEAPARQRSRLRTPLDHQRSAFLRGCRLRLKPEDVGLPATSRSRTGGLRREDVAALSGVSASWYAWLEQGRSMRVSDGVLERVSQALRLSGDERTYLYSLVQHRAPRLLKDTSSEAPPDVLRMIHAQPHPAVVMNLRCDILAWNAANSALYFDYGTLPPNERNLLEMLVTRPS